MWGVASPKGVMVFHAFEKRHNGLPLWRSNWPESAKRASIEKLAPHDLRRSCARLCHLAGGELDQIQFLLGHISIQTTERYLGCKQKLRFAVNDRKGVEPDNPPASQ